MSYNDLRKGRHSELGREYFITFVVNGRKPVFKDFYTGQCFAKELQALNNRHRSCWLAWVLMPDHFHGLLKLAGSESLSQHVRRLKGNSARRLNQLIKSNGTFWQPGYFDRALRQDENRKQIARYMLANPLRGGLVKQIGDYSFWDAVWLDND